jgi:hypothetical protein
MLISKSHRLNEIPKDILDMMSYMFKVGVHNEPLWGIELQTKPDIMYNFVESPIIDGKVTCNFVTNPLKSLTEEDFAKFPDRALIIKDDCPGDPERGLRLYKKHFCKANKEDLTSWCLKRLLAHIILTVVSFVMAIAYDKQIHNPNTPVAVIGVITSSWVIWVASSCFLFPGMFISGVFELMGSPINQWEFKEKNLLRHIIGGILFAFVVQFILNPHGLRIFIRWAFHV